MGFTEHQKAFRKNSSEFLGVLDDIRKALVARNGGPPPDVLRIGILRTPLAVQDAVVKVLTVPQGSTAIATSIFKNNTNSGAVVVFINDIEIYRLTSAERFSGSLPLRGGDTISVAIATALTQTVSIALTLKTPRVQLVGKPTGIEPMPGSTWTDIGLSKQTRG